MNINFKDELKKIRAFVFDVDGVMTDSTITFDAQGNPLRNYNVKDGYAIMTALSKGYIIGVITGGKGIQLSRRMEALGIKHLYMERESKIEALESFSQEVGIPMSEMIYVGDDIPDLAPMSMVRLSVAPNDAVDMVRLKAHYVSHFDGGRGVVRDVVEQVMMSQQKW